VTEKPAFDAFGRDYARLSFGIERHVPGFIDAYLGPVEERAVLDPDSAPPDELVAAAHELLSGIPAMDASEDRKGYLTEQVVAMLTTARRIAGDELPYREEVRLLFDIEPQATPESAYDAAIADLDRLLSGDGSIAERMIAWRQDYTISPETARRLVDVVLPELRERTQEIVDLPSEESSRFAWSRTNLGAGTTGTSGRDDLESTSIPISRSTRTS
jgi:hypothetical protein